MGFLIWGQSQPSLCCWCQNLTVCDFKDHFLQIVTPRMLREGINQTKAEKINYQTLIYLVVYLKHFLSGLFPRHDLTCHLKQSDPRKQLKQWFAALHNLLTTTSASVKSHLLACLPHFMALQYKIKYQLDTTLKPFRSCPDFGPPVTSPLFHSQ